MWENIINNAINTLSGRIQNGVGINPVQAENAVQLAGESSRDVLIQEARDGNVEGIVSLFKGEDETSATHPLTQKIMQHLRPRLVEGMGLRPEDAKEIEHATVPYILKQANAKLSGEDHVADTKGVEPDSAAITALFGGPDTMTEGMRDRIKKELTYRI